jgi:hypothetical protein
LKKWRKKGSLPGAWFYSAVFNEIDRSKKEGYGMFYNTNTMNGQLRKSTCIMTSGTKMGHARPPIVGHGRQLSGDYYQTPESWGK